MELNEITAMEARVKEAKELHAEIVQLESHINLREEELRRGRRISFYTRPGYKITLEPEVERLYLATTRAQLLAMRARLSKI